MAMVTFYGQAIATPDLNCASVMPAIASALDIQDAWPGWSVTTCSNDPVAVNTIITLTNQTNGDTWTNLITSVVDNPTSPTVCTPEPFDYAYAAGLWSLAFTTVVGLYLVSRSAGTILDFIRGRV